MHPIPEHGGHRHVPTSTMLDYRLVPDVGLHCQLDTTLPEDNSLTATRKTCIACRQEFWTNTGTCPSCGEKNLVDIKRDAFIGRTLADRYQVESIIGTGGMGVVYKAWQEGLKRSVAVKVLRHQFLNDEMSVKRFQQEAIAASRLAHPHIVALHDYGSTGDGYLFMVMDIIDGKSLAQEEREKKTIGVDRSIKIITQVCDALEHAHRNGIVHRDLKPGNIMLTQFHSEPDYVKLVDFGIAKLLVKEEDQELTQKGEVFGSPLYMSPEQCLGKDLDGRSDIYSLGTVLYEALTGFVPHLGRNAIETIDMQIHKDPMSFASRRPDIYIPERLESVILKALAKDPAARQQSMKELALELEAAVPRKNDSLNLRVKMEPAAKVSSWKELANLASVIGGFVIVLIIAGLGIKHSMDSSPSNMVPATTNSAKPVSTQTSTPAPTPSTTVATPSANTHAPLTTTQSPKVTPDHPPPGSELPTPNESTQATVKSASQVKQGQAPRHKVEPPKPKPVTARVAKVKRDPWARIESRMKKTAPKATNTKSPSRWSHIEQLLPVSP